MRINADFTQRVVVHHDQTDWTASPSAGVERKMLDRIGDEVARATTIVRFAPGSAFAAHTHDGGEEYIVLDGVFQDEEGDFPVGTYVRNPPTSRHTPAAADGATIFVKLHQFHPDDREHVRIDTGSMDLDPDPARQGVSQGALFRDQHEDVRIEAWQAAVNHTLDAPGGAEILVLSGALEADGTPLAPRDWLRLPPGSAAQLTAGPEGVRLWIKTGHLSQLLD